VARPSSFHPARDLWFTTESRHAVARGNAIPQVLVPLELAVVGAGVGVAVVDLGRLVAVVRVGVGGVGDGVDDVTVGVATRVGVAVPVGVGELVATGA
jgi:hypothetical protein